MDDNIEEWKQIPGFENYYASNFGRIKSVPFLVTRNYQGLKDKFQTRSYGGKLLKQHPMKTGGKTPYLVLTLCRDKKHYKSLVHRLILTTFKGECPNNMQACHNDGNGLNNHIDNLRWDTPSNNQLDRKKHGTNWTPIMKGSSHPRSKLTEEQVLKIREDKNIGISAIDLSKIYKLDVTTIHGIIARKSWKHI